MDFVKAFIIGGLLCAIGQIILDKTKLTPARLLVIYVVTGVILTAVGIYAPLVEWAGAGATVPLTGFGYALAEGVRRGVATDGVFGAFTGGITATAAGIAAAVVFGFSCALLAKSRDKS
ncbi:MAG: stage V sporulation protein AE [Oscillospiraceae bacterium]|nr:stage V sporulation protein AE [Oscillospiraceae bacterium]